MGVKPIKDRQALTADGEKALPTAAANNVKNLSVGSTGADVVKLQKALGIDADGIFGPQTQQAVINYQKANGLDPDGIFGPLTEATILQVICRENSWARHFTREEFACRCGRYCDGFPAEPHRQR
jgi:peptidoglycan hydrolase-like protein with peptidoglycan-binding domain